MALGRPPAPGSRASVERAGTSLLTMMVLATVYRAPGSTAAAATPVVVMPAVISPSRSEVRMSTAELWRVFPLHRRK